MREARKAKKAKRPRKSQQEHETDDVFWWAFFERLAALKEQITLFERGPVTDFASQQDRLEALREQLTGAAELARQDAAAAVPKELASVKRWYLSATPEQRESWARGHGPNVPPPKDIKPHTLAGIQQAYDEAKKKYGKAPQETVASMAGRARSTVERYWAHIKK